MKPKVINTNNEDITNKNFTVNANFLQRHYKSGYDKALEEVEKMINEIKNPYPTDIFPEITERAWKDIQKVLNDKFLGFPFDRISANLMRRARINLTEELKQELKEKKEK
jgi:hypothetical protein